MGRWHGKKKLYVFSTQTQSLPIDSIYTYTHIFEITPFGPLCKISNLPLNKIFWAKQGIYIHGIKHKVMKNLKLLSRIELICYSIVFVSSIICCVIDIIQNTPIMRDMNILILSGVLIAKTVELNQLRK
jgi:hypothetical protein